MKQTAVEWLINEMHKKERGLIETSYNHLFDQAKEMEKEQIIRAFTYAEYSIYINSGEQYYNETFNK